MNLKIIQDALPELDSQLCQIREIVRQLEGNGNAESTFAYPEEALPAHLNRLYDHLILLFEAADMPQAKNRLVLKWRSLKTSRGIGDTTYFEPGELESKPLTCLEDFIDNLRRTAGPIKAAVHGNGLHPEIQSKCEALYSEGHLAEAVEKSFKVVKDKLRDLTGHEKGSDAFGTAKLHIKGAAAPNVDSDFNQGAKFLMMAIDMFRNEKSHTSNAKITDPVRAHQYLMVSSLAMSLLDNAEIPPPTPPEKHATVPAKKSEKSSERSSRAPETLKKAEAESTPAVGTSALKFGVETFADIGFGPGHQARVIAIDNVVRSHQYFCHGVKAELTFTHNHSKETFKRSGWFTPTQDGKVSDPFFASVTLDSKDHKRTWLIVCVQSNLGRRGQYWFAGPQNGLSPLMADAVLSDASQRLSFGEWQVQITITSDGADKLDRMMSIDAE